MEAADIMTRNPEYVEPNTTVQEVVEKFMELEIRHLPVVKNGKLVGMISDRDLRDFLMPISAGLKDPKMAEARLLYSAKDVMHAGVITVTSESGIGDIIDLMIEHKFGAIPVIDAREGTLCGIISYLDVLKAARDYLEV